VCVRSVILFVCRSGNEDDGDNDNNDDDDDQFDVDNDDDDVDDDDDDDEPSRPQRQPQFGDETLSSNAGAVYLSIEGFRRFVLLLLSLA
jgi:hypothetical protein